MDSQDSPRNKLWGSHHLPPYNIFVISHEATPKCYFSWDSQIRSPKVLEIEILPL